VSAVGVDAVVAVVCLNAGD